MADLSIIIVNYKSAGLIRDSLLSFLKGTELDLEIIIVDNNSDDRGLDRVATEFPGAVFLQMGYNSGFARANNYGIQYATAETVLLLNPDTISVGKAIDDCFRRLRDSRYVAAGVQLLNEDGSPQISGSFFPLGGLNNLLPLPVIGRLIKSLAVIFRAKSTNVPDSDTAVEVDWINGAFLMVKKTGIKKAGMLDNDFFLYAEEIEWCSRLRKITPLVLYGDLKFTHLQGTTANQVFDSSGKGYYNLYDKKGGQILLSNFVRIRKQYGAMWFLIHLIIYSFELPLLSLYFLFKRLLRDNSIPTTMLSGYMGNLGLLFRNSPKILSGRPHFYKVL